MKSPTPPASKPKRKTRDQRVIAYYENSMKLALHRLLELLNPEDVITWGGFNYRELLPYAHDFLTTELKSVELGEEPTAVPAKQPGQTALEL